MEKRAVSGDHHLRCPAYDVFPINKTEESGITAVVTIVPHHKVASLRYRHWGKGVGGRSGR